MAIGKTFVPKPEGEASFKSYLAKYKHTLKSYKCKIMGNLNRGVKEIYI